MAGETRSRLERDDLARETRRLCQEIRTYQNLVSFGLVSVVGVAYVFSLWNRTDSHALLMWYACFSVLTIIRAYVYESVRRSLDVASPAKLLFNEMSLVVTGLVVCLWLGMSFWMVGLPGDERTVLAISVLSCVYATGTTINSATQTRHLLVFLAVILGPAILFWAGLGNRTDYAMVLLLSCLFVLLYTFALRNRAFIVESVRIRLENKAHNDRLIENRTLVEDALQSALEANRSKSHFIATVSHDMGQPINALTYLLQSLKNVSTNEQVYESVIDKIEACVGLLERQFEGFVDLSRYDANDMEIHRNKFDLTALCRIVVENAEAVAAEHHVEIRFHGMPAIVVSDSVLFGRVLGNLLDNAVKFGGKIVDIRLDSQPDWVIVEVQDNGVGIRKEDLPKIFGEFVQLQNQPQAGVPGAGLGLSIVSRITEALGIELFVDSTVGQGTLFTLIVPVEPIEDEVNDRPLPVVAGQSVREILSKELSLAVPKINLQGKTILLVDDERSNTDALAAHINDLGGRSVFAASAAESFSLVKSNTFDLAIVGDWLSEEPKVLTLCSALAKELGADRVVIVTTNNSKQRQRDIEQAGFSVYYKPLNASQLQAILSARLGIGLH